MIPNVSEVLIEWSQIVKLKTVVSTTLNFQPVRNVTVENIAAVIQPADMELLNAAEIDWSRRYLTVHSRVILELGQLIEYRAADYKIIRLLNYADYGYYEAVIEETKTPLVIPVAVVNLVVYNGDQVINNGDRVVYTV